MNTRFASVLLGVALGGTAIFPTAMAKAEENPPAKNAQAITVGNVSGNAQLTINQIQKDDPQLAQAVLLLVQQVAEKDRQLQKRQSDLADRDSHIARLQEELAASALRLAEVARSKPDDLDVQAARAAYLQGDTAKAEALFLKMEEQLVTEARKQQQQVRAKLARAASIARERAAMAEGRNTTAAVAAWSKVVEYEPDEPGNWRRYGDLLVTAGDLSRAAQAFNRFNQLARARATQDSENRQWQRDISISFEKLGGIQQAQGDLATAQTNYQKSLAISDQLAAADPSNRQWQQDLFVNIGMLGNIQRAQGDLAAALTSYQKTLAITEQLAVADPSNSQWQSGLVVSYSKLAQFAPTAIPVEDAEHFLEQALVILGRMQSQNRLTARQQQRPTFIKQQLAELRE